MDIVGRFDYLDLVDNILFKLVKNFLDSKILEDIYGYGIYCVGIVVVIDNDKGVIGVVFKVLIVFVKVLND